MSKKNDAKKNNQCPQEPVDDYKTAKKKLTAMHKRSKESQLLTAADMAVRVNTTMDSKQRS
jgi:hypothetical protein